MEKKCVLKPFFLWNFEKEEAWINDMALDGWMLFKIRYVFYYFEKDTPGAWEYNLELKEKDPYAGSREGYLDFLKESGVEVAARSRYWIYLRSRRGEYVMGSEEHALQQLVRTLKAQKFAYKLQYFFTRMLAFSIACILCLKHWYFYPVSDFLSGTFTGVGIASIVFMVCTAVVAKEMDRKVRRALRNLHVSE